MAVSPPDEWSAGWMPSPRRHRLKPPDLPVPLTPLVGREREIAALVRQVHRDDVRFVTLTGPGGVGKTRLALRVAEQVAEDFPDGVWFVPLAPITDPALVAATIARTFGVREVGNRPILTGLAMFLRDRRVLLVLDNFEGVAEAAPLIGFLLGQCPHLKLLVTSRSTLDLYGERTFDVPPLALPGPAGQEPASEVESVRLFTDRAQAARATFALTSENTPTVIAICRRLDGVPLAIELAAAWTSIVPPTTILSWLEQRLPLLTGRGVDQPQRLRTMQDALAWSHDLLSREEQVLFRRLGIFGGGFGLDAAEHVSGVGLDDSGAANQQPVSVDHHPTSQAVERIAALVNKSLLRQVEPQGGHATDSPRFGMLEPIRDFALDQLEASEEAEAIRRRHAEWYRGVVGLARATVGGMEQEASLRRLELEHDNLRGALRWALDRGDPIAARMGGELWRFWYARSYLSEGRRWLEAALAQAGSLPASVRAPLLLGTGAIAQAQGDSRRAGTLLEEALTLFRAEADRQGTITTLNFQGLVARDAGDYARAVRLHEEALSLARATNDPWRTTFSLNLLGPALERQGHHEEASTLLAESLAIARARGDRWSAAEALTNLGHLAQHHGEFDRAKLLYDESIEIHRALGNRRGTAQVLTHLGVVAARQGDPAAAAEMHEEAGRLFRDLGDGRGLVTALLNLGFTRLILDDLERAHAITCEGLSLAAEMGDREQIVTGLERIAEVEAARGQTARATRLAGAADQVRRAIDVPLLPAERSNHEHALGTVWHERHTPSLRDAWDTGGRLTLEQAVEEALSPIMAGADHAGASGAAGGHIKPFGLTPRELDVLRLLAEGRRDREIADLLFIGHRTVATHVTNILGKLGVESRTAAATYAVRHGLA